ncbi:MAG: acyl carrier protein [Rhizobiales bacterium]|nr:acyl carrier protein [Hyphomicrobiales bacterium]
MSQSIEKDVRDFILENFLFGDESRMPDVTESLLEADLIDSTGILELVAYLEQHFGLAIADAEIVPANLDSIASICAFVTAKSKAPAKLVAA